MNQLLQLNPQSRNHILDGIKKLRDQGATIVYTTHYMEEVEILCDRIIILDKGKIIAQGTSDELKKEANIEEKIERVGPTLNERFSKINRKGIEGLMFIHNLNYTVKILFKNKVLIFWMFAFPIILGIFFHMAFENIEKDEALQVFDIAVIDNKEYQNQTNLSRNL